MFIIFDVLELFRTSPLTPMRIVPNNIDCQNLCFIVFKLIYSYMYMFTFLRFSLVFSSFFQHYFVTGQLTLTSTPLVSLFFFTITDLKLAEVGINAAGSIYNARSFFGDNPLSSLFFMKLMRNSCNIKVLAKKQKSQLLMLQNRKISQVTYGGSQND